MGQNWAAAGDDATVTISTYSLPARRGARIASVFDPQPLHYRPLESRANLFAD